MNNNPKITIQLLVANPRHVVLAEHEFSSFKWSMHSLSNALPIEIFFFWLVFQFWVQFRISSALSCKTLWLSLPQEERRHTEETYKIIEHFPYIKLWTTGIDAHLSQVAQSRWESITSFITNELVNPKKTISTQLSLKYGLRIDMIDANYNS